MRSLAFAFPLIRRTSAIVSLWLGWMSVKDQLRGFWPVTCTRAEDETKSSRGSTASSIQRFRIVELPTFVTEREYRIVSPGRPTSAAGNVDRDADGPRPPDVGLMEVKEGKRARLERSLGWRHAQLQDGDRGFNRVRCERDGCQEIPVAVRVGEGAPEDQVRVVGDRCRDGHVEVDDRRTRSLTREGEADHVRRKGRGDARIDDEEIRIQGDDGQRLRLVRDVRQARGKRFVQP